MCKLVWSIAALLSWQAAAQVPPPVRDPDVAEAVAKVRPALAERDGAGVLRSALATMYWATQKGPLHPDDRSAILQAGDDVLRRGALREGDDRAIYGEAARVLAALGERGSRIVQRVYGSKRFPHDPDWAPVRAALVRALGQRAEESNVDFLIERATRSDETVVLVAAGGALGVFEGGDEAVRKRIAEALIGQMAGLEAQTTGKVARPGDMQGFAAQNAAAILEAIYRPWNDTLRRLTGARCGRGVEWQQWWNEHRAQRWGAASEGAAKKEGAETPGGPRCARGVVST